MDWGLLFGGGAFGLMLVTATSGFVYLIMRLMTNPLKEDLVELQVTMKEISAKIKGESDLIRLIQQEVVKHERNCSLLKQVEARIGKVK